MKLKVFTNHDSAGCSTLQSFRTTKIQGIKTEVAAPPPPSPLQSLQSSECVCSWAGRRIWTFKKTFSGHSWNILDDQWYDDERNTPSFTQSFLCCQFSIECSIGRRNYVRVSDPASPQYWWVHTNFALSAHRVLQARLFPEQFFRAIAAFSAPFQSNSEKFMRNAAIALNCYKQCFRMALEKCRNCHVMMMGMTLWPVHKAMIARLLLEQFRAVAAISEHFERNSEQWPNSSIAVDWISVSLKLHFRVVSEECFWGVADLQAERSHFHNLLTRISHRENFSLG